VWSKASVEEENSELSVPAALRGPCLHEPPGQNEAQDAISARWAYTDTFVAWAGKSKTYSVHFFMISSMNKHKNTGSKLQLTT
jgi:hypothetical protein